MSTRITVRLPEALVKFVDEEVEAGAGSRAEVVRRALERERRRAVAMITTTARGLAVDVPVGQRNGLDQESVINCDNVQLVHRDDVGEAIGFLLEEQEEALAAALVAAFDLRV